MRPHPINYSESAHALAAFPTGHRGPDGFMDYDDDIVV
jgi:hypothetical protein